MDIGNDDNYDDALPLEVLSTANTNQEGSPEINYGKHNREDMYRGKTINIFINGDDKTASIPKAIPPPKPSETKKIHWESVVTMLHDNFAKKHAYRTDYLLSIPDGRIMRDFDDLTEGGKYCVSNSKRLVHINYDKIKHKTFSHKRAMSSRTKQAKELAKSRPSLENGIYSSRSSQSTSRSSSNKSSGTHKARILRFTRNDDRSIVQSLILNPGTNQSFEEILHDLTATLQFPNGMECGGLYAAHAPYKKVGHLFSI